MRFNFMLHADKKAARKWKDLPIPFPPIKEDVVEKESLSGVEQLPDKLQQVVYRPDA